MARFEFEVTDVFDIRERSGLVVAGIVRQGVAYPDTVLRDAVTGHSFRLRGIDLACAPNRRSHRFSLVVDRAEVDSAQPGHLWVADGD